MAVVGAAVYRIRRRVGSRGDLCSRTATTKKTMGRLCQAGRALETTTSGCGAQTWSALKKGQTCMVSPAANLPPVSRVNEVEAAGVEMTQLREDRATERCLRMSCRTYKRVTPMTKKNESHMRVSKLVAAHASWVSVSVNVIEVSRTQHVDSVRDNHTFAKMQHSSAQSISALWGGNTILFAYLLRCQLTGRERTFSVLTNKHIVY